MHLITVTDDDHRVWQWFHDEFRLFLFIFLSTWLRRRHSSICFILVGGCFGANSSFFRFHSADYINIWSDIASSYLIPGLKKYTNVDFIDLMLRKASKSILFRWWDIITIISTRCLVCLLCTRVPFVPVCRCNCHTYTQHKIHSSDAYVSMIFHFICVYFAWHRFCVCGTRLFSHSLSKEKIGTESVSWAKIKTNIWYQRMRKIFANVRISWLCHVIYYIRFTR